MISSRLIRSTSDIRIFWADRILKATEILRTEGNRKKATQILRTEGNGNPKNGPIKRNARQPNETINQNNIDRRNLPTIYLYGNCNDVGLKILSACGGGQNDWARAPASNLSTSGTVFYSCSLELYVLFSHTFCDVRHLTYRNELISIA